jgi:NAD(P) transhydrogenase subunit alpha
MRIAIPHEALAAERRVAASPDSVKKLIAMGFSVSIESGAGVAACYTDAAYAAAGATVVADPKALYADAAVLLKVRPPHERAGLGHELDLLPEGATVLSFLYPARNQALLDHAVARRQTCIAMDQVPRISRAQKLDALSSMANIAGYRAVILAANHFGSFFTGQMTAAGKVAPAKVLVIGAGVAGLAALGAAKGLGAIVRAFDTRPAVRDQVGSMGGEFLEVTIQEDGEGQGGYAKEMSPAFIAAEMALFRQQAKEVDIVITTALIPGKPAPKLWLRDMVESMKPGSVIVDLAAEAGGNCDLTRADEVVVHQGVTVLGPTDLPSQLATTASQLYAQNLVHLLTDIGGAKVEDKAAGDFALNLDDEVVRGSLVVHRGAITWPPPKVEPKAEAPKPTPPPATVAAAAAPRAVAHKPAGGHGVAPAPAGPASKAGLTWASIAAVALMFVAMHASDSQDSSGAEHFIQQLTVFALSCFVGFQVIWSVAPALHTPLMAVTNAISGVIVVGGMLHMSDNANPTAAQSTAALLALLAVLFATVNIGGGFLVTQRMLKMFRK